MKPVEIPLPQPACYDLGMTVGAATAVVHLHATYDWKSPAWIEDKLEGRSWKNASAGGEEAAEGARCEPRLLAKLLQKAGPYSECVASSGRHK